MGESILSIQKEDSTKLTLGDTVIPVPLELDILVLYFCKKKILKKYLHFASPQLFTS